MGDPREPDPWHSRSQLFDKNYDSFTGNPFSVDEVASDDSLSEENMDVLIEPISDNHHSPDVEQRYINVETVPFPIFVLVKCQCYASQRQV